MILKLFQIKSKLIKLNFPKKKVLIIDHNFLINVKQTDQEYLVKNSKIKSHIKYYQFPFLYQ